MLGTSTRIVRGALYGSTPTGIAAVYGTNHNRCDLVWESWGSPDSELWYASTTSTRPARRARETSESGDRDSESFGVTAETRGAWARSVLVSISSNVPPSRDILLSEPWNGH